MNESKNAQLFICMLREENIRLIFGLKLKQLRQENNLNLSDLASASGLSISYLNEIEKGKKYPKAEKISAIAIALGTTYDELVSLKMSKKLELVAEILSSNFLQEMPLDLFGLELNKLADLVTNAPAKLNAFISTLIEISRNYDLKPEEFYLASLRAYQELHDNYFPELEDAAQECRKKFNLGEGPLKDNRPIEQILTEEYGYEILELNIEQDEKLKYLRSVYKKADKPYLYINPGISYHTRAFILSKELAYSYLKIEDRPTTATWVESNSFDQLLNSFKSAYFATALYMPAEQIAEKLKEIFNKKDWKNDYMIDLMEEYGVRPEALMYRMTSVLPKFFQLRSLFFLRIDNNRDHEHYNLTHELHLAMLHNPHGSPIQEHYCRRWVSISILQNLKKLQLSHKKHEYLVKTQRSNYFNSENQYFCISIARPKDPVSNSNTSTTIGLLMNEAFKRKVKFWNDANVIDREVNDTCERCPATDCLERAATPNQYLKKKKRDEVRKALKIFRENLKPTEIQ